MGLRVRPNNKAEVVSVEEPTSTPQRGKAGPVQSNVNSMLIVFVSIFTELCNTKLFNQDELQTNNNILTPHGVCGKMWGENNLLTLLCLCVFLAITKWLSFHTLPTHHTYFPLTPDGLKGKDISYRRDSSKMAGRTCLVFINALYECSKGWNGRWARC